MGRAAGPVRPESACVFQTRQVGNCNGDVITNDWQTICTDQSCNDVGADPPLIVGPCSDVTEYQNFQQIAVSCGGWEDAGEPTGCSLEPFIAGDAGGPVASVTVYGSLAGAPFVPAEVMGLHVEQLALVVISNRPGACAAVQKQEVLANQTVLAIAISGLSSGCTSQIYEVGSGVSAFYWSSDAECTSSPENQVVSGSVTVTRADESWIEGRFDFEIDASHRISGSFAAPTCDVNREANSAADASFACVR